VACHDVRMSGLREGEFAAVIGGGPIGILVSLVAKARGARVLMAEVNAFRLQIARDLGIDAVNPLEVDLPALVNERTAAAGADVVFEVSGSQAGADMMTKLPRTRGRIVVVAIYGEAPKVDLFRFFWRELQLSGARVYEPEDFELAIQLASTKRLPLAQLITDVLPLASLDEAMQRMEKGGNCMKILVSCTE
jgi:threonine dehydrogenase-like Zn-dependent dehydrogenase